MVDYIGIEDIRRLVETLGTGEFIARLAAWLRERPADVMELADRMIRLVGRRPGVDIDIAITGMRPGEKLAEELVGPGETVTGSGPILGINPVVMPAGALDRAVDGWVGDGIRRAGGRSARCRARSAGPRPR